MTLKNQNKTAIGNCKSDILADGMLSLSHAERICETIWRHRLTVVRRWSVRLTQHASLLLQPGIVVDDQDRVLLLKHRFSAPAVGGAFPAALLS